MRKQKRQATKIIEQVFKGNYGKDQSSSNTFLNALQQLQGITRTNRNLNEEEIQNVFNANATRRRSIQEIFTQTRRQRHRRTRLPTQEDAEAEARQNGALDNLITPEELRQDRRRIRRALQSGNWRLIPRRRRDGEGWEIRPINRRRTNRRRARRVLGNV